MKKLSTLLLSTVIALGALACDQMAADEFDAQIQDVANERTAVIFKDAANKFRWNLKSGNGEVVLRSSQGYTEKADAKENLLRALVNGFYKKSYKFAKNSSKTFVVVGPRGEVHGVSETYNQKSDAVDGMNTVQSNIEIFLKQQVETGAKPIVDGTESAEERVERERTDADIRAELELSEEERRAALELEVNRR